MNSKSRIITLLDETTKEFIDNCRTLPVDTVGTVMLNLSAIHHLVTESNDPLIDDTDKEAIRLAIDFMNGFYDDDTQPNVRPIVDNLSAFYKTLVPQPVSILSDHDNSKTSADGSPLAIDEWSSKNIGEEVYQEIITSYLRNDLQVTRILCQALTIDHIKQAHEYFTANNDLFKGPKIWVEFIECFNDYCNG